MLKRRLLVALGLEDPAHPLVLKVQRARRVLRGHDRRLRESYLRTSPQPRLQIGGGAHRIAGWLNTDLEVAPEVMLMDATRPFPFADGTFEYIYSEHMIEHVDYGQGIFMLAECQRVLRPGGVVRIVTPDLAACLGLFAEQLSAEQQRYLSWFYDNLSPADYPRTPVAVLNAMSHLWGHRFLYDEPTLAEAMRGAGFEQVVRRRLCESEHATLQGLENVERYPPGLLEFESVALEGRKRADRTGE